MIQPNEIRVNNYYNRIDSINHSKLGFCKWDSSDWYRIGECIDYLENYEPIHLTEEILLKCGEKYNNSGFNLGKFKVLKSTEGVFIIPTNNKLVQIYFVHDLQNFYYYYENTKTELIINL